MHVCDAEVATGSLLSFLRHNAGAQSQLLDVGMAGLTLNGSLSFRREDDVSLPTLP